MKKDFNIILDLDQTLISAEPTENFDFQANKKKAKLFEFVDMDGYFIVFERPGLQKFLDYLFHNFNVSVWTAASKDYALFVIEKIVLKSPDRKLDWIFFDYHCDISEKFKKGSKDLSILWDEYKLNGYNQNNTLIIDDYNEVYDTQPDNCIIAKEFQFKNEKSHRDTYFKSLQKTLKNLEPDTKISSTIRKINEKNKHQNVDKM